MEVLPRAIATSSVVVAASSAPQPSSSKNAQVRLPVSLPFAPFLRPASALAASILASAPPAALALNYDDYVKRATESASSSAASSSSFPELPSIELPSVDFDGATDFVTANPLALVVGLVAVTVPFIASRAFAGPQSFGSASAVDAYDNLSDPEQNAQLLDIRAPEDIKAEGSPNLKSLRKKAAQVAYAADDDAFVDKVIAKFKDAENTTLYILERFDGSASAVAKLLANSGFKGAYAIKGGAEGQNGWQDKELPWSTPPKSFTFNIDSLKSIVGDGQGVGPDTSGLLPTTLGVAAAAGVGLVVLSEAETALQLLGSAAVVQLFVKKFLFAEDRKKTFKAIQTFLDTKIAPKEFVEEIKEVGRVLLPKDGEVKAAVATGATVLEKELEVDSVTPEALAEKAAEKLGVEIPDVEAVKSDLQSNVEAAKSELQSNVEAAKSELGSNVEAAKSGVESGVEAVKSAVEPNVKAVESGVESGAEAVKSAVEPNVKAVESGVESGVEAAKSAVESDAAAEPISEESTISSNGSTAPAPAAVEEEKPSALPTLLDPPTLPTPTVDEAEVETPAVAEAPEPSTNAASSAKPVTPFFESDQVLETTSEPASEPTPVSNGTPDSALAAFEGDEPSAFVEEGVGENITAKKLEEVTASSRSADSSS